MSYHRVLPRPLPLSNEDLASRWTVGQDSLKRASIMTHEIGNDIQSSRASVSSPKQQDASNISSALTQEQERPISSPVRPLKIDGDTHEQSPALQQKPPSSGVEAWEGDIPGPICLCQPDPKIPRPRNAFILYRQHHQASIVAQNPGLPNPEISKVIGDHWRASPPEVKEHWKSLAEEEKVRHQKQYPDYRYQPRRAGRASSVAETSHGASSSGLESNRCAKCGGKSISSTHMLGQNPPTPAQSSPTVPQYTTREQSVSMPPPPTTSAPATARLTRPPASPAMRDGHPQSYRFSHPHSAHAYPLSSPRHIKRPPELMSPASPDSKRRRLPYLSHTHNRTAHGPQTPIQIVQTHQRHPSLSNLDLTSNALASPNTLNTPASSMHGSSRLRNDSLRLPPLHTPAATQIHTRSDSDGTAGAKTLEAMIHSIPLLGKIRLLGKVAGPPPLNPFPDSPLAFERKKGRGPVICIDSADSESLNLITEVLKRNLDADCNIKVFAAKDQPQGEKVDVQSYLRLIDKHHDLSKQAKAHVTPHGGVSDPTTEARKISSVSRQLSGVDLKEAEAQEEDTNMVSGSPLSPKTTPELSRQSMSSSAGRSEAMEVDSSASKDERLPVAILPGWHLTQTDYFAINVPITDSYSPIDHWQWHLTFWRGIVGADVTVAVQPATAEGAQGSSPVTATSNMSMGLSTAGTAPDPARHNASNSSQRKPGNGIDIRLEDSKAIILQASEKGTVVESALRRVGFEIGEWIRGWSERESN